jgi:hypothetical protein
MLSRAAVALAVCEIFISRSGAMAGVLPNDVSESSGMIFSNNATWVGGLMLAIAGLTLLAAIIGPLVRWEMPEELPPMQSHDEPPGSSGHHGKSGTLNPTPPNDHVH